MHPGRTNGHLLNRPPGPAPSSDGAGPACFGPEPPFSGGAPPGARQPGG
ncbi:hypothetical protein ACFFX0_07000 [Citricoccus parietis]|uniref:Uncharacterized protein n=1 Tax=Citricoccus parietis TaxID=592307 RepID=A0ABV5FW94_9MICC